MKELTALDRIYLAQAYEDLHAPYCPLAARTCRALDTAEVMVESLPEVQMRLCMAATAVIRKAMLRHGKGRK